MAAPLRGASAEALAALSDKAAHVHALADAAQIGQELFGVAEVLSTEATLRRVLTDGSIDPQAKSGLARSVFDGKVGEQALGLVVDAVERRWTAGRDLPQALAEVAAVATVRSSGAQGSSVSDELFAVRQVVTANPELRSALADSSRSAADRTRLLLGLLGEQVQPATARLVEQAVRTDGSFDAHLNAYQRLAAGVQGQRVAVVHAARPLSDGDVERLASALGRQYDADVRLHVVVEPGLVGGLRVEIGDDVIDGTVAGRLDDARRLLVG